MVCTIIFEQKLIKGHYLEAKKGRITILARDTSSSPNTNSYQLIA